MVQLPSKWILANQRKARFPVGGGGSEILFTTGEGES